MKIDSQRNAEQTSTHHRVGGGRHGGMSSSPATITTEYLLSLLASYGLSEAAFDYVRETLTTEPSRSVGQFATKSVCGAFSSPSQGLTLQFESRTAELAWLVRWELDEDVIGCRDQPPLVDMKKADKNGVVRTSSYTPDFLLLRQNDIVVVEVKTEQELVSRSEKYPEQWQREDGVWHYRPAETRFAEIGLRHVVVSGAESAQIETSNLRTLVQLVLVGHEVPPTVRERVLETLEETAWLTVAELLERVPDASNADLFTLLLGRCLFADLGRHLLTEPRSCLFALDEQTLVVAREADWDAPNVPPSVSRTAVPDRAELERALARLARVHSGEISGQVRRLRRRIANGKAEGLTPLQSLVSPMPGNTRPKIPPEAKRVLTEHIRSCYMSTDQPTVAEAWTDYRNTLAAKASEVRCVSRKTYQRYIDGLDPEEVARARGGKRAGNSASRRSPVAVRALTAQRAMERVSIDHSLLKIRVPVVTSGDKVYSRRPWMTGLVDDSTDCWLAFFLSFQAPSKRSLSMLIRNCAREHGRLPETIHSDRGGELRSVFWSNLLAHFGMTTDYSPAGHSRFNSEMERLNKQVRDQWLSRRPGNTIDYLEKRKYSKGYRPEDLATIDLEALFLEIDAFRKEYNRTVVGTSSEAPQRLHEQGMERYGFSGIPITLDDEFLLVTAYDTNHGEYKVGPAGDVVISGLRYSHPKLARLRPKRSRTEVRVDPEDPYRIYCRVEDEWVTALNR